MEHQKTLKIPQEVRHVLENLKANGFEAFIVGGCVRDVLRGVEPKDWDVTTNAKPEEIQQVFPKSFYENKFLTVTVQTENGEGEVKEVEVTTYRLEAKYTDKRHPDEVSFAKTLQEDLARRDFTVNAMALQVQSSKCKVKSCDSEIKITDLFGGQKDLKNKVIRTVGKPEERFSEDALRLMRAVRFSVCLAPGWTIEEKTKDAIKNNSQWLRAIAKERIRDEFLKIIMSPRASEGVELLRELGLLKYILPEMEEGWEIEQSKHHIYGVYEHGILSLKYAAKENYIQNVRLAALLHDIGKPRAKRGQGQDATFYGHEIVGYKMTVQALERLKFPKKDIEKIAKLVKYHLFYYNVDEVTDSSVRRLVRNVGPESVEELLQVRMADRIGSGVPKAEPYKLRHLKYVMDRVAQDPISASMIKVSGDDIMTLLSIRPGPKVGQILDVLLGIVLGDPKKNKKEFLEKETKKLGALTDNELKKLAQKAKEDREQVVNKRDDMTKAKYWVT